MSERSGLSQRVAFHGSVRWERLDRRDGDLVVADSDARGVADCRAGDVVVNEPRIRRQELDAVRDAIREIRPRRVIGVGGGCAIDAARLAWLDACDSAVVPLVVAPCGRELWRAFAPFAVVLESEGSQATTADRRLAGHDVVIDGSLIDTVDDDTLLLTAVDVLVATIESLLTRRAQPYSRAVANAAGLRLLPAVGAGIDGGRPDSDAVIVASALAVEAFASTGLGLAHGISTNLAALLQVPQDRINAIGGRWVIGRWGEHPALAELRRTAALTDGIERSLTELVDAAMSRLRLATLRHEGVTDGHVDVVLPRISQSSGIPWLPEKLGVDEIRRVVYDLCDPEATGVRTRLG